MSRTHRLAVIGSDHLAVVLLSVGILPLLFCGDLSAQQRAPAIQGVSAQTGKALFQRKWDYKPPTLPQQGNQKRASFERRLMALPGDGLGPLHNAVSCESCHADGGDAGVDRNVTLLTLDPRNAFIPRTDRAQTVRGTPEVRLALLELYPSLLSPLGLLSMETVVHEKSTRPLYGLVRDNLRRHIPGGAPRGWFKSSERTVDAIAEKPVLSGRMGEIDFYLSQRNSPALFGANLIDNVAMSRLNVVAKAQARRSRGKITGRLGQGKFGWRAQTATLDRFVRGACTNELGLQISRQPQAADPVDTSYVSLGVDMKETDVRSLVRYVRSLPPPIQETYLPEKAMAVRQGKQLFEQIGCNDCHIENLHPARGLFSDLLLHDMGSLLQAASPAPIGNGVTTVLSVNVPVFRPREVPLGILFFRRQSPGGYFGSSSSGDPFSPNAFPRPIPMARPEVPKFPRGRVTQEMVDAPIATWDSLQREWRTPPLWGVADSAPYLHDGRAATLDSAILWHDGEASDVIKEYRTRKRKDRRSLVVFLESLRAPAPVPDPEPVPVMVIPEENPEIVEPVLALQEKDDEAERLKTTAEALKVFDAAP